MGTTPKVIPTALATSSAYALWPGLHQVEYKGNDCKHKENEKQDLGYFHCARCNAAEAKQGGNQGNHKKHNRVVQHDQLLE
jgi:hypothetical protein